MVVRHGMQGELTEVAGAVGQHMASVPEEQRKKEVGKQNWGTFETHYQRSKGISQQESMAEIDRLIAQGQTDDGRPIEANQTPGASTKDGSELQRMLAKNGIKADIKSYSVEGGTAQGASRPAKSVTETTETRYEMEGEKKDGLIAFNAQFKANPDNGAAAGFLQQYQSAEAAKYKPGYANRNPNGVN
jgi:hypothetical protein